MCPTTREQAAPFTVAASSLETLDPGMAGDKIYVTPANSGIKMTFRAMVLPSFADVSFLGLQTVRK